MRTISQLAKLVRENKADQIVSDIKESPSILIQEDEAGVPLAHLLAQKKQLGLVQNELDAAALESYWGLQGWTLAHTAAAAGSAEPLKEILKKNQHVFYWGDNLGRTPIHIAAQHAHLDQFDVQVTHLTVRDNLESTPLHAAALNSCLHQVAAKLTPEMLLMINLSEETVLELAAELSTNFQSIPAQLKNVVWEAEFISDPKKRTITNVLHHHGIKLK